MGRGGERGGGLPSASPDNAAPGSAAGARCGGGGGGEAGEQQITVPYKWKVSTDDISYRRGFRNKITCIFFYLKLLTCIVIAGNT